MKPNKFALNSVIVFISIVQIILSFVTKFPWWMMFIGLGLIILLIPDFILKARHKKRYLIYKGISQFFFVLLSVATIILGGFLTLLLVALEDIARGCGGTTNIATLDKVYSVLIIAIGVCLLVKVIFNIVDFIKYKKEKDII
jgi:hypothetical protein